MNTNFIIKIVTFGLLTQPAWAEVIRKPITDANVFVFNAVCYPVSESEGFLKVQLQVEKESDSLRSRGDFFSFSDTSKKDSGEWKLIPISRCRELQIELSKDVGKSILLSGQIADEPYDAYVDVWGTCRIGSHDGGGSYPCKKGVKKITMYRLEIYLSLGSGIYLLNKSQ